jgi:hypothetical protein
MSDEPVDIIQHAPEAEVQPVAEQEQSAPTTEETASPESVNPEEEAKPESKTFTQEDLDKILLREKRATERRVRRELEASKPQQEPVKVESKGAPSPDDYTDYTEYTKALAEHVAEERWNTLERQKAEQETQRKQSESVKVHQDRINDLIDKGESKYDDFHVKVPQSSANLAPSAMDAILECSNAEDIVYFLATNDEEAERISSLSPAAQAKEIGKLEDRLAVKKPVKTPGAPPPLTPVKGGKTPTTSIEDMDMDQFIEEGRKRGAIWARNR